MSKRIVRLSLAFTAVAGYALGAVLPRPTHAVTYFDLYINPGPSTNATPSRDPLQRRGRGAHPPPGRRGSPAAGCAPA